MTRTFFLMAGPIWLGLGILAICGWHLYGWARCQYIRWLLRQEEARFIEQLDRDAERNRARLAKLLQLDETTILVGRKPRRP